VNKASKQPKAKEDVKKTPSRSALPDSLAPVLAPWIPVEEAVGACIAYEELLDAWGKRGFRKSLRILDEPESVIGQRSHIALVLACSAAVESINGSNNPSNERHAKHLETVVKTIIAGTMPEKESLKWLLGERAYLGLVKLERQIKPLLESQRKKPRQYPRELIEKTLDLILKRSGLSIDESAERLAGLVRRELEWKGGSRAVPDCIRNIRKERGGLKVKNSLRSRSIA